MEVDWLVTVSRSTMTAYKFNLFDKSIALKMCEFQFFFTLDISIEWNKTKLLDFAIEKRACVWFLTKSEWATFFCELFLLHLLIVVMYLIFFWFYLVIHSIYILQFMSETLILNTLLRYFVVVVFFFCSFVFYNYFFPLSFLSSCPIFMVAQLYLIWHVGHRHHQIHQHLYRVYTNFWAFIMTVQVSNTIQWQFPSSVFAWSENLNFSGLCAVSKYQIVWNRWCILYISLLF